MSVAVTRYHPALIVLHWLLAVAIGLAFVAGSFVLDEMANDNIHKPGLLRMHMTLGGLILLFTVVRLIVRVRSQKPAALVTGKPLLDKMVVGIHHLLYTLTVLAALGGMALAYQADLFAILYQHAGTLPKDFEDYAAHDVHGVLAFALIGVAAFHVAGALQHQFILKDGIFSRISFVKKD